MFHNSVKVTGANLIWKKTGLKGTARLYSSACLHCKESPRARNTIKWIVPRRNNSSSIEQPRKSHFFKKTFALVGLSTGAVVAYAKYDPDFRKIIKDESPAFDNFIKVVTQEERSFEETYNSSIAYVSGLFSGFLSDPPSQETKKDLPAPKVPKPVPSRSQVNPVTSKEESKTKETPVVPVPLPPSPTVTKPSVSQSTPQQSPKISTPLGNSDEEIRSAAIIAVTSLRDATAALKGYSDEIGKLLDGQVNSNDPQLWNNIRSKTANKESLVASAERSVSEATERLNAVRAVNDKSDASQIERDRVRRLLDAATDQVESARRELEAQKQRGSVTDRYWSRVEEARRHFQEEIQSLFPNANISEKKLQLSGADLDLFLLHVFSQVVFYQRELARLESIGDVKIRQALERSGEPANEQLIKVQVNQAVAKERRRLEEEFQRKLLIARSEQEKEARVQLKRQLETAQDHLNDVLAVKESDLERRVARRLDERDTSERSEYESNLSTMLSKLKALELVLDERIEADRNAHQAHVLFSACQSLFRALRSGIPGTHWSEQLRPLNPEMSAVSNAVGGKDALVSTVLASVPPEARHRGVYPETALRERFLRVEQVARRVALVPEEGGSLLRYLLSYIQSTLLFSSAIPISTKELRNEAVDLSKMDTYDLLQRARYWVDRGDLNMSLRYMNLLRGASRAVASEWMNETRIYLETQLIVNTLMAHAAATGMLYL